MFGKLVTAGLLCAAINAHAGFFDGNSLAKDMQEWEKYERKDPLANTLVAGVYLGYVAGVADAYDETIVCPADNSNVRQLSGIVAAFLKVNPTRWAEPADVLVKDALLQSFPCKKK